MDGSITAGERGYMKGSEVLQLLVDRSGLSRWGLSRELGKAGGYLDSAIRRGTVPSLDTAAGVADCVGCDLVLVDRATGDTVARVDPPEKDGGEG